ncbi:unnamed protein product [Ectocarpus fasciculatus]
MPRAGPIPPELGKLAALESLNLTGNHLTDCPPPRNSSLSLKGATRELADCGVWCGGITLTGIHVPDTHVAGCRLRAPSLSGRCDTLHNRQACCCPSLLSQGALSSKSVHACVVAGWKAQGWDVCSRSVVEIVEGEAAVLLWYSALFLKRSSAFLVWNPRPGGAVVIDVDPKGAQRASGTSAASMVHAWTTDWCSWDGGPIQRGVVNERRQSDRVEPSEQKSQLETARQLIADTSRSLDVLRLNDTVSE